MNLYNNYTMDPTRWSNYLIHARAVDPKRGKTPEEVKKYTRLKIAAIAIKTFLALSVVGIIFNVMIIAMRSELNDQRAIINVLNKLPPDIQEIFTPVHVYILGATLAQAKSILITQFQLKQKPSDEDIEDCVRRGYVIASLGKRGGGKKLTPEEQVVIIALTKTWDSHINRGGLLGMY